MDRISALRNVEDALAAFEQGEIDLATAERRVRTVLRTYATTFDEGQKTVYRVAIAGQSEPVIVVAATPGAARDRATALGDGAVESVHRLEQNDEEQPR